MLDFARKTKDRILRSRGPLSIFFRFHGPGRGCSELRNNWRIKEAGPASRFAYEEFIFAEIRNKNTRRAYQAAVRRFLAWIEERQLPLAKVTPKDVGTYIDGLMLAVPSKKLHRAGLNHSFDLQVKRHAVVLNPVSSVRNERYSVSDGKTPEIIVKQARKLFRSIDVSDVIGLCDRAILAVLAYSGSRVGAVAKLKRKYLMHEGDQWVLAFEDKGGKHRKIPVRHDLQRMLFAYMDAAAITELDKDLPLFRSAKGRSAKISQNGMADNDMQRMFKRRLVKAGLSPLLPISVRGLPLRHSPLSPMDLEIFLASAHGPARWSLPATSMNNPIMG